MRSNLLEDRLPDRHSQKEENLLLRCPEGKSSLLPRQNRLPGARGSRRGRPGGLWPRLRAALLFLSSVNLRPFLLGRPPGLLLLRFLEAVGSIPGSSRLLVACASFLFLNSISPEGGRESRRSWRRAGLRNLARPSATTSTSSGSTPG